MVELVFPPVAKGRGVLFWLNPAHLWASRRVAKADHSNEWRYAFEAGNPPASRSVSFATLLDRPATPPDFSFAILGDTGEGDRSQWGLLPLLRRTNPDFIIINGDVAYPAGRDQDFVAGFFEPYRGLGKPIWATAGNHEYYSPNHGREFYDLFCTRRAGALWSAYGNRLVPQPGMYWELRDPGRPGIVVIGLDTGMKANLDGHTGWLTRVNPLGRAKAPDSAQHTWLEERLSAADARGDRVMVLFHIPGLASQEHDGDTHLGTLHRILAGHASVKAVVCAHVHSHQRYTPEMFETYVAQRHGGTRGGHAPPHYVVSGHGGAALDGTVFKAREYEAAELYPTPEQWTAHANWAQRVLDRNFAGALLTRAVGLVKQSQAKDVDAAKLLSFLLVRVRGATARVSQVYMDDLQALFSRQPGGTRVYVDHPHVPLDPDALDRCTRHLFEL